MRLFVPQDARPWLGLIIDKFYGLGKMGISGKLLFTKLPYPVGKESLDCLCGDGRSPAFGFGPLIDAYFAPASMHGSFDSKAVEAEMASPAQRKRVFEVLYGPKALCSGSCSEVWKDVEVIYDVAAPNQRLGWKPGPLASLPAYPELGSRTTYGELMSCPPPPPPPAPPPPPTLAPPSSGARSGCPGGSLVDCIGLCPADPKEVFQ